MFVEKITGDPQLPSMGSVVPFLYTIYKEQSAAAPQFGESGSEERKKSACEGNKNIVRQFLVLLGHNQHELVECRCGEQSPCLKWEIYGIALFPSTELIDQKVHCGIIIMFAIPCIDGNVDTGIVYEIFPSWLGKIGKFGVHFYFLSEEVWV